MTPGPRVLLVDDDADTLALYSLALTASGMTVDLATTGEAALAAARSSPPAVIVTDLTLPDVDGIELCPPLQAAAGPSLKGLIILSGSSDTDQHERARQAGATAVLTKPCLPEDLERFIRAALEGSGNANSVR